LFSYFVILLLFNSYFINEILHSHSKSIALSQNSIDNYGDDTDKLGFYYYMITNYDMATIDWLSNHKKQYCKIYDAVTGTLLCHAIGYYGNFTNNYRHALDENTKSIEHGAYIPLFYVNVRKGIGAQRISKRGGTELLNMTNVEYIYKNENIIYDNGGSAIYYKY